MMAEVPIVILDFRTLFACRSTKCSAKESIDSTLLLDEKYNSSIRESSFGERYLIQQHTETTMSTVPDEFNRMGGEEETISEVLLPSQGVLLEILKRSDGRVVMVSCHRSKAECMESLIKYQLEEKFFLLTLESSVSANLPTRLPGELTFS